MSIPEERKIIIRLPPIPWKTFLTIRFFLVTGLLGASLLFTYWYQVIWPYLWIPSAHVNGFCTTLCSDSSGMITEIVPHEGDFVRKGDSLFAVDSESRMQRQKQMEVAIDSLNERMRTEKARMEKAMEDYLAVSEQIDLGIGSQESLDRHLSLMQQAQGKSEEAASRLTHLNREYSDWEEKEKKRSFTAPFDAIVLKKSKNLGDLVPVGEPVYTLVDPHQIWIEAEIPEEHLSHITLGLPARVRLPAYPGQEWAGKVVWISPATVSKISSVLSSGGPERIAVKIALENQEVPLKLGLSARVGLKVH